MMCGSETGASLLQEAEEDLPKDLQPLITDDRILQSRGARGVIQERGHMAQVAIVENVQWIANTTEATWIWALGTFRVLTDHQRTHLG